MLHVIAGKGTKKQALFCARVDKFLTDESADVCLWQGYGIASVNPNPGSFYWLASLPVFSVSKSVSLLTSLYILSGGSFPVSIKE